MYLHIYMYIFQERKEIDIEIDTMNEDRERDYVLYNEKGKI